MNNYPPLQLISRSEQSGREFISRKNQLISYGCRNLSNMTPEDYIDFFLSDDFYNPFSKHKYKDINLLLKANESQIFKDLGDVFSSFATEWRDLFLAPVIIEQWSKYKQVYKPDTDFADALLHTSKLEITKSMVEHLPCTCFYIDVSDGNQFGSIVGIFMYIKYSKQRNDLNIACYMLTDDMIYFSFYTGGKFNNKNILMVDFDHMTDADYIVWNPIFLSNDLITSDEISTKNINISRKTVALFSLQLMVYLSIEKPDISESDLTKNTYKPKAKSAKIRNKWSEVHIEDVGVKYGSKFRKQVNEIKQYNSANTNTAKRKSPIPHFRCAHWHKYLVGKGRKEIRVNWIEPVFVGNSDTSTVIIHKVEQEETYE